MPEKTWLETRKKRTRWYVVFFLIVAVAGAAVFIRNNREMLLSKSEAAKQEAVISISDAPKSVPKEDLKDEQKSEQKGEPASRPEKTQAVPDMKKAHDDNVNKQNVKQLPETQSKAPASSVLLPDIKCSLRDRGAFKVVISLELFMADDSFKREVLLKRENLKVMVQKVLAAKTLDELIIDSLRSETKTAINTLLEKNTISDVEFRDFRIDKVK